MRNNRSKNIILFVILAINIILLILDLITNCEDSEFVVASVVLNIGTLVVNYIIDSNENKKKINLYGSLKLFETYDRDNVVKYVKDNLNKKHLIYVNCSKLNFLEVENIKQKIYEYFSDNRKIMYKKKCAFKIQNVFMPEKLDFESLNVSIFSNKFSSKKKINLYIFDYNNANYHFIKRIEKQFDKNNNNDIKNTYIIYLASHELDNKSSNELTPNELEKLLGIKIDCEIKKLPKINNVLVIEKIMENKFYKEIVRKSGKYIYIIYYMEIGEYDKALSYAKSFYVNSKDDLYFKFLLADCLHLLNYYFYSYTILIDIIKDIPNNLPLYKEVMVKLSHVLKHIGLFNNRVAFYNVNEYIDSNSNDILMRINWDFDVEFKIIKNNYLAYLYFKLKNLDHKYNLDNLRLSILMENSSPSNNMYLAAFIALKEPTKALNLINESIEYFDKFNDKLRFNAYYIKGEILRVFGKYEDAYQYYIKASGILENHLDLNLLDQCYFSLKALERLNLVNGIASSQIRSIKNIYFNDQNIRKDSIIDPKKLLNMKNVPCTLLFNEALISFIDYKATDSIEKILVENIFIIL